MSAKITIIGLGSGDENQLTLGIWRKLQECRHCYMRTMKHPVAAFLRENQLTFTSFDEIYEQGDAFPDIYETIVERLLSVAAAHSSEIVYAVPGHPMVAEQTTQLLRERCPRAGVELQIMGGESFLDQAFLRFGFDPIEGFQLIDGSLPFSQTLNPQFHVLVTQVYDYFTAADVKLSLMETYPDEYPVQVGHALGVAGAEQIVSIPLYELDRIEGYGNLSVIWVPRMEKTKEFN